jgi:chromosome segregation ATPase
VSHYGEVELDIEQVADELYGSATAEFTQRRAELVGRARQAGQAEIAKAISELRRPTVAAGLINRLVRGAKAGSGGESGAGSKAETGPETEAGLVGRLLALGGQLRAAQAELDGQQIRELTRPRHDLVAALVARASTLAAGNGQKASAAVQRELEETFGAALADEQASLAVTSGRLTRALVYAGFGEVDVSAATATPLNRASSRAAGRTTADTAATPTGTRAPEKPEAQKAEKTKAHAANEPETQTAEKAEVRAAEKAEAQAAEKAEVRAAELAALRDAAKSARAELTAAEAELVASTQQQQTVRARESELADRLSEIQREILKTRHDLDATSRTVATADRTVQRQERQVRNARRAAEHAEHALARFAPDD